MSDSRERREAGGVEIDGAWARWHADSTRIVDVTRGGWRESAILLAVVSLAAVVSLTFVAWVGGAVDEDPSLPLEVRGRVVERDGQDRAGSSSSDGSESGEPLVVGNVVVGPSFPGPLVRVVDASPSSADLLPTSAAPPPTDADADVQERRDLADGWTESVLRRQRHPDIRPSYRNFERALATRVDVESVGLDEFRDSVGALWLSDEVREAFGHASWLQAVDAAVREAASAVEGETGVRAEHLRRVLVAVEEARERTIDGIFALAPDLERARIERRSADTRRVKSPSK